MSGTTNQFQGPVNSLLQQLSAMADGFFKLLPLLAIALVIVIATWLIAKGGRNIADRVTGKTEIRPSLKALIDTLVTIFVWVVGPDDRRDHHPARPYPCQPARRPRYRCRRDRVRLSGYFREFSRRACSS